MKFKAGMSVKPKPNYDGPFSDELKSLFRDRKVAVISKVVRVDNSDSTVKLEFNHHPQENWYMQTSLIPASGDYIEIDDYDNLPTLDTY